MIGWGAFEKRAEWRTALRTEWRTESRKLPPKPEADG
jgi:hypothetical protein